MVGYKHPCRYCDQFIPSGSSVCPLCGKSNPLGPLRCPQCKSPIQKAWVKCNNCGLTLSVECPHCHEMTYFSEYCQHCQTALLVKCINEECAMEQPPIGDVCVECGTPFKEEEKTASEE